MEKLYETITELINRPPAFFGSKIGELMDKSPGMERTDIIHELFIYCMDNPTDDVKGKAYNWLRREVTKSRLPKITTVKDIENLLTTDLTAPSGDEQLEVYRELLVRVQSFDILDDIDWKVLRKELTREVAAHMKDMSYAAYQKSLWRKKEKIKQLLEKEE